MLRGLAPSDNQPYGVGAFEMLTFPAWAPRLSKKMFGSHAHSR